jgi:hypothetical protein
LWRRCDEENLIAAGRLARRRADTVMDQLMRHAAMGHARSRTVARPFEFKLVDEQQ